MALRFDIGSGFERDGERAVWWLREGFADSYVLVQTPALPFECVGANGSVSLSVKRG